MRRRGEYKKVEGIRKEKTLLKRNGQRNKGRERESRQHEETEDLDVEGMTRRVRTCKRREKEIIDGKPIMLKQFLVSLTKSFLLCNKIKYCSNWIVLCPTTHINHSVLSWR